LARAEARLAVLEAQLAELDTQQQAAVRAAAPASPVRQLVQLKGVATTSASVLLDEGLVWRQFQNRRQIGGLLGFAPTPFASGDTQREQGISRAGNERLQAISIQLAWNWVRWQPTSTLTLWYRARFGTGKRARRIGIVALARKLVIALWRYVTGGVVPAGASSRDPSSWRPTPWTRASSPCARRGQGRARRRDFPTSGAHRSRRRDHRRPAGPL
jgi:transposase